MSAEPEYKLTVLYGYKEIERPRYSLKTERLGGLPYRYWIASQFDYLGKFGPFYTRSEAAEMWNIGMSAGMNR